MRSLSRRSFLGLIAAAPALAYVKPLAVTKKTFSLDALRAIACTQRVGSVLLMPKWMYRRLWMEIDPDERWINENQGFHCLMFSGCYCAYYEEGKADEMLAEIKDKATLDVLQIDKLELAERVNG